ncbi:MAG: hypothetical protein ACTHNW_00435 [Mucilaginibacter sp.]
MNDNILCCLQHGAMKKKRITAGEAVKILAKSGVIIDEKEAEKVLEILYFLAKLIVNQNFK